MIFTIQNIAASLADYLAPVLPGVTFYENPNQQKSEMPCMFLQQRGPSRIENKTGKRFLRYISLDLTYLEDYNLTDLQERYQAVAEALDYFLETFPYKEGENQVIIRTYDRQWSIDLDAMHYKFELRVWVEHPTEFNPMQELIQNQEVS